VDEKQADKIETPATEDSVTNETVNETIAPDEFLPQTIWGKERDGLTVGARLISSTGQLSVNDPIVVQFLIRNESDEQKTFVLQFGESHPVLGADNRIELNLTGTGQQKRQHTLDPGEVLEDRTYRMTVNTAGLLSGRYSITAGAAFLIPDAEDANRASSMSFGQAIPVTIGDPDSVRYITPPVAPLASGKIHWGKPVGGVAIGIRLPEGREQWTNNSRLEAQVFICNVSGEAIDVQCEIPTGSEWQMRVSDGEGNNVPLDCSWNTGFRIPQYHDIALKPGQVVAVTGVQGTLAVGKLPPRLSDSSSAKSTEGLIPNPAIQVLKEKTEYQYGDPQRIITTQGSYQWQVFVTIRQPRITDMTSVVGSSKVPFQIKAD